MNITKGKSLIEQLVEDFSKNEAAYLSKNFNETEARTRFIDPLFKALGWEFEQNHLPFDYWDVHREYPQRDNSATKKPDYAFRINRRLKFFVEAKAPWVPLTDKAPVFQAKRYAYSTAGKAPIVILTDFEEFRVFNALERPYFDNPLQGLLKEFDMKYQQYPEKWELLYEHFSKEAVANGSIERLAGKYSAKHTKKLDDDFLEEITGWREKLAKNIAIRNADLNAEEINEAVQRILDRLIFIRNLEDRDIEPEDMLLKIAQDKSETYPALIPLFQRLTGEYNGLLFKSHFSENLNIDDKVIKNIILEMCYPRSPFRFDVIEPEVLGHIYERFLGSEIRLTKSHQAKVEEKPEVRKAGGVYYTPEYIVNYIVKQTVGKVIDSMPPEEIKSVKIADPACGSGSFLLGAFDYLIQYHAKYYTENRNKRKYRKDFYETPDGTLQVSLAKKGEILRNNIFGADIDSEATEVAMMSLYLKLLDRGFEKGQLQFLRGHVLPDLTGNIKCGNSLIGSDFYEGQDDLEFEEVRRVNPFDWEKEFPDVFKNGGFDVVIGNPPYIQSRSGLLSESDKIYYEKYFKTVQYQINTYGLFIEKGINLLKKNGLSGMIIPNYWLSTDSDIKLRNFVFLENHAIEIINLYKVFENASVDTLILIINHSESESFPKSTLIRSINRSLKSINERLDSVRNENWAYQKEYRIESSEHKISVSFTENFHLKADSKLGEYFVFQFGMKPYEEGKGIPPQTRKMMNDKIYNSKTKKDDSYLPLLRARNVKRYSLEWQGDWIKYGENLAASRSPDIFTGERILIRRIISENYLDGVYTSENYICNTDVITLKPISDKMSIYYFLGILLSKPALIYLKGQNVNLDRATFPKINANSLEDFPIRPVNFDNPAEKSLHDQIVNFVERILNLNNRLASAKSSQDKSILQREIDNIDKQVDQLVYKLYDLTTEEINIAEESFLNDQ